MVRDTNPASVGYYPDKSDRRALKPGTTRDGAELLLAAYVIGLSLLSGLVDLPPDPGDWITLTVRVTIESANGEFGWFGLRDDLMVAQSAYQTIFLDSTTVVPQTSVQAEGRQLPPWWLLLIGAVVIILLLRWWFVRRRAKRIRRRLAAAEAEAAATADAEAAVAADAPEQPEQPDLT